MKYAIVKCINGNFSIHAEGNKALDYIAFLVAKVDSLEKRISELEKGE